MKRLPFPVQETGLVLFVKNYRKCVRFYSDEIGLAIRFQKPYLTVFNWGKGYLLIERGQSKNALCHGILRFNVRNVPEAVKAHRKRGLKVRFYSCEWGDV